MGQILSSVSGNEKASQKNKTSSPSSRQFSQYSQYVPQRKSESIFSTPQPSYDTEWLKIKIRKQEVERLRQAKQAREEEAERLRLAKKAREQEAERLKQARQAREQEAIKLYLARQQEKASQVSKNTTSLSNRSYNVVASSERKLTSGTNDNTTHVTITASGVTSGTKDNTSHRPSMDNKKTTSLGIKGNPTSFSDPYNISSKSEKNTTSLSKEDRENVKRITEIVRSILTRDKNYVVYGNWSCPHWPISCNNEYEWQYKYSLESLRSYLTLNQKSKKDVFMNKCKECDKESLVTSFFLYNRQPNRASVSKKIDLKKFFFTFIFESLIYIFCLKLIL
ncbi:hypothetical protein RirG_009800 [Rhizophagus irregularis DAOM 197198w]|uniref:Uncharacterized protein n=1 Tax=Rhizophagus irregularis (strain DAOM 197198w) TaxID=1432141 RepID=A0A015M1W3_RHIIW|nr:hypothetical protein RirG_009800 [Rhizophagus irregularis DAOM 197198w]